MANRDENWAIGSAYEPYVGRWSRRVAGEFLRWLAAPPGIEWLDAGCGTGALTETILRETEPAAVTGIDTAEGFVAYAREHVQDVRASFKVADATELPFDAERFGAIVSGLALNFIPRQAVALAEMARVAKRGGIVAAYVWDYAGEMQMMRLFWDAAVELDPAIVEKDEGRRFAICQPEPLARLFQDAELTGVEVRAIDIATTFRDFDDYWQPFLGGQGTAPTYTMSLPDERRAALRELIRSRLPIAPDGSISLIARAWAVRGNR